MYAPKKQEPGMDDGQAQKDREALTTEVRFLTGNNAIENPLMGGGLVVGNPYDTDPLGEEYHANTYVDSEPMPSGFKSGGATQSDFQEVKSSGGGMKSSTPQNYSKS